MQLVIEMEQVLQKAVAEQFSHFKFIETVPVGQVPTQVLPDNERFLQAVQLLALTEQVAHSESQGVATPELLK